MRHDSTAYVFGGMLAAIGKNVVGIAAVVAFIAAVAHDGTLRGSALWVCGIGLLIGALGVCVMVFVDRDPVIGKMR